MPDSRRLLAATRPSSIVGIFIASLIVSLSACWLFGSPSPAGLYIPDPDFPAGLPVPGKTSIIIPTYHEADSIRATITDLEKKVFGKYEIIVVDDDSRDGTDKYIKAFNVMHGLEVRLITRTDRSGLSSAVLDGMAAAQGDLLLVMDADGQHPPEAVAAMMRHMENFPQARMALGARDGYASSWPWYRRLISWVATLLAAPLVRGGSSGGGNVEASDPMTGLFAVRADVFRKAGPLNATGFKVALELLVKSVLVAGNWDDGGDLGRRVVEVAYTFEARAKGSSKLGGRVIVQYALQLFSLYYYRLGALLALGMALLATAGVFVLAAAASCLFGARRRYERLQQQQRRRSSAGNALLSYGDDDVELKEHSA